MLEMTFHSSRAACVGTNGRRKHQLVTAACGACADVGNARVGVSRQPRGAPPPAPRYCATRVPTMRGGSNRRTDTCRACRGGTSSSRSCPAQPDEQPRVPVSARAASHPVCPGYGRACARTVRDAAANMTQRATATVGAAVGAAATGPQRKPEPPRLPTRPRSSQQRDAPDGGGIAAALAARDASADGLIAARRRG